MDDTLYEFLSSVFTCEMNGTPYAYLAHDEYIVTNAMENGYVKQVMFNGNRAISFTTKGHLTYCGECSKRETAKE